MPLSLLTLVVCIILHKLCIFFGGLLRIWHIDEVIENITKVLDDGDDIEFLLK
jgi:hypothetical protein